MGCNFVVLPASELTITKTYLSSSVKAASGPDLLIWKSCFPPCFRKSLSFCCLENKRREKKKKKTRKLVRQLAVLRVDLKEILIIPVIDILYAKPKGVVYLNVAARVGIAWSRLRS